MPSEIRFQTFRAVIICSFSRGTRFWGQICSNPASRREKLWNSNWEDRWFWVITRCHQVRFRHKLEELCLIRRPDFSKPSKAPQNQRKPELPRRKLLENWKVGTLISAGVKTEKIRKGRILGGLKAIWGGIFGNPSLTKIQEKTNKNLRKTKKKLRKTKKN